ncbi:hypothetical protein QE152_g4447 [Popillia japonica]|uniref:Uncharacterized protein n=1 Tax=Popillia japonica TaxID=7064 RepID=A0AAW1N110_POPJA
MPDIDVHLPLLSSFAVTVETSPAKCIVFRLTFQGFDQCCPIRIGSCTADLTDRGLPIPVPNFVTENVPQDDQSQLSDQEFRVIFLSQSNSLSVNCLFLWN